MRQTFARNAASVDTYQDEYWDKVGFLFQGAGAGGAATDRSKNALTLTKTGSVGTDSTGVRWGLNGLSYPTSPTGVNSYKTGVASALDLRTGPWTVEGRFKVTQYGAGGGNQACVLFSFESAASNVYSSGLFCVSMRTSDGAVQLSYRSGASSESNANYSTVKPGLNNEFNLTLTYDGSGTFKLTINGTTDTFSGTLYSGGGAPYLILGFGLNAAYSQYGFRGSIYALRVTKGVARPDTPVGRNLPFPINSGTPNVYTPGDGSGGAAPGVEAKGQYVTTAAGDWTVPAGVTSVAIVCIGMEAKIGATTLVRAKNGDRVGDMGGDGGLASAQQSFYEQQPNPAYTPPPPGGSFGGGAQPEYINVLVTVDGGGGGAGGYGSSGGAGGQTSPRSDGAGAGGKDWTQQTPADVGKGASLRGTSPGGGTLYGGGPTNSGTAQRGRALAAKNAIAVTPGQTISFTVVTGDGSAGTTAARVMWGGWRSFPLSAGDV